jgi:hypothetical protein
MDWAIGMAREWVDRAGSLVAAANEVPAAPEDLELAVMVNQGNLVLDLLSTLADQVDRLWMALDWVPVATPPRSGQQVIATDGSVMWLDQALLGMALAWEGRMATHWRPLLPIRTGDD